ncbi:MAG: TIGR04255 family protein [Planctomycetes bacterium]|nr:TIGR04255 family protein [Planctomycetota bacterium]
MAFHLDLNETFPHLGDAPIVEAVFNWQSRPVAAWTGSTIHAELANRLPEYSQREQLRALQFHLQASLTGAHPAVASTQDNSWQGLRLTTDDRLNVAVFSRNGLAVSRLKPYSNWETFSAEATRLWHVFVDLAQTNEVSRLGVRFINRLSLSAAVTIDQVLRDPPTCPANLTLQGFLYRSTFAVPGESLGVNVAKTEQPARPGQTSSAGLIIDIDVFTNEPFTCDDGALADRLAKFRWLKNKVFFELLKPEAIEQLHPGE